jgi:hypothetical protein
MEKTLSNKISYSSAGLNIKNLNDTYEEEIIKNLIKKLTNQITWPQFKKEILSIQASEAIWSCPICSPNLFHKQSWVVIAARIAKKYKLSICPTPCPFIYPDHDNSIGLISTFPISQKTAINLFNLNIKTYQNLLCYNSTERLSWHELATRKGSVPRGPIPNWFSNIPHISFIIGNTLPIPNPKARFWAFYENSSISFIKPNKRSHHINNIIKGRHYILSNKTISKCSCQTLQQTQQNICTKSFHTSDLTSVWTFQKNNQTLLANNINELLLSFKNKLHQNNFPIPNITISSYNNTLPEFINPTTFHNIKTNFSLILQYSKVLIFFDNSIIQITLNERTIFLHSINNVKIATLQSIIIILCIINKNSSLNCITSIPISLDLPSYSNKQINYQYSTLTNSINQILANKNIKFTSEKTKSAIKIPDPETSIDIDSLFNFNSYTHTPKINGKWFSSYPHWIKKVQLLNNLLNITTSSSISNNLNHSLSSSELINLHFANSSLNKQEKYKSISLKAFRTKLLGANLPVRQKLHDRYPSLYPNNLCPRCSTDVETQAHIFSCIKSLQARINISNSITKKIHNFLKKQQTKNKNSSNNNPWTHINHNIPSHFTNIALGLLPPNNFTQKQISSIMNSTLDLLYNLIWIPRSATANLSLTNGIKWNSTNFNTSSSKSSLKQNHIKTQPNLSNQNLTNLFNKITNSLILNHTSSLPTLTSIVLDEL